MSDPSNTQYEDSPKSSPKRRNWIQKPEGGPYGSGPGLIDPDDPIQNSDDAYKHHLEKQANAVGDGPTARRPSNQPDFEHCEQAPNTTASPHTNRLHQIPTPSTNDTQHSTKSKAELEHHNTLSTIRTKIGLGPEPPIVDGHDVHDHLAWSSIRVLLREPFAEFFGTFIMVLFGDASVAQVLLSTGQTSAPGGDGFGSYQSINWGWGIGVMLGIYVAGDSGGFLNPAVTFCFCLFRKLPWRRFPIYFLAQFLGGFCASGVVYANYLNGINKLEGHGIRTVPPSKTATAGIFCTYPQAFLTKTSQFFSEFIASTILMFVIFALKDDSNPGAMGKSGAGQLFPLALLFLIFGLGACFGFVLVYLISNSTSYVKTSTPLIMLILSMLSCIALVVITAISSI